MRFFHFNFCTVPLQQLALSCHLCMVIIVIIIIIINNNNNNTISQSNRWYYCCLICRCITCRKVPSEVTGRLCSVIEDRCRIPWIGGAIRLRPDVIFPVLLVPCCLLLASIGPVWTFVSFSGTFALLFAFYRVWRHRQTGGRRTRVFFVLSITSISATCYIFLAFVVSYREIFLWEVLLLLVMVAAMVYFIFRARHNPGIIHSDESSTIPARSRLYSGSEEHVDLSEFEVMWVDSRPIRSNSNFCIHLIYLSVHL